MTFKDQWDRAGEDADDFEPPRGTYQTVIVDGSAFTSRKGDDFAKVILQIRPGAGVRDELVGRRFQHFMGFGHEVGARINREALELYGIDGAEIDTIEDLDLAINALARVGVEAEVVVSYKDGYMQVKPTGVRIPGGDRDIPTDMPASNGTPEPAAKASFADAAKTEEEEEIPF